MKQETIAYATKVAISDNVIQSYAVRDRTINEDETSGKSNAQILTEEFIYNFTNARQARIPFEKKWNEMNMYVWGRVKNKNDKNVPTETAQNLLWGIFQRKLAEMCADNLVNFDVTPARIPQGDLQKNLKKMEAEVLLEASLQGEDPEQIQEQLHQMFYTDYIGKVNEFNSLLKQLFHRAMGNDMLKRCYTDGLITGTSVVEMVYSNAEDNEVVSAVHVPIYDCYIEPGTVQFQDSRYFIVSQQTNLLALKANPFTRDNITPEVEAAIKKSSTGFWDKDTINYENDQRNVTGAEQIPYHRYYKRYLDDSGNVQVACYHFVGNGTSPILVAGEEKLGISQFPFAILFFNKRTDQLYGKSFLDFLLPTQKLINKYEAIVKLRLLQSARPQIFLARNSGIDPKKFSSTKLTPGMVHLTNLDNPGQAVSVIQLDQVPGDFVQFLDRAQANLNLIANVNDAYTGDNKITNTGSQAAASQLNRALLPEKLNSIDIQTFIRSALQLIIEWVTQHDSVRRSLVYINPTDPTGANVITFTGTDYKDLSFNLNLEVHIKTASEKQAEAQAMMNLYQMKLQFPGLAPVVTEEELVDALDLTNKENALTRIQMQKQADVEQGAQQIMQVVQMMVQQQAQIQQQSTQIQTAVANGQMDSKQANQAMAQVGQPLSDDDAINIISDIMRKATGTENEQATTPNSAAQPAGANAQQG